MEPRPLRPNMAMVLIAGTVLFAVLLACVYSIQQKDSAGFFSVSKSSFIPPSGAKAADAAEELAVPATKRPGGPILTPTPDAPHPLPPMRLKPDQYTVQAGDFLALIAKRFGVSAQMLVEANNLNDPNLLIPGSTLTIPVPTPEGTGPDFKIIPDSELVYGPAAADFNIADFIQSQGGFLASYSEDFFGQTLSGSEIVTRIAHDYSVNPRLLLAILEYQSGWVTKANSNNGSRDYPLGLQDPSRKSLYRQLAWAAINLNAGYYGWRVNGISNWITADGNVVPVAPTINAGTAGVQQMFASVDDLQSWLKAVSPEGVFATYNTLFGYPFDLAIEPLLPPDLKQPKLQLPFENGQVWSFTGGPHAGWDAGSAWAAIDFAPPGQDTGCVQSDAWVVAAADGKIVRTGIGEVIQDLDGDGVEQTGWVVFYMHIEARDRVQPGTFLKAGERIGHPSCEGGVSSGTHVHLARRYNGEWIPADQNIPFVLDSWVSHGEGGEYNGYLERNGQKIEAYSGRSDENGIQR